MKKTLTIHSTPADEQAFHTERAADSLELTNAHLQNLNESSQTHATSSDAQNIASKLDDVSRVTQANHPKDVVAKLDEVKNEGVGTNTKLASLEKQAGENADLIKTLIHEVKSRALPVELVGLEQIVIQGEDGAKGEKGDTGDVGPEGKQGIQGIAGLQGIQGIKGDQGKEGPIGATGKQGNDGKNGKEGPRGFPGANGGPDTADEIIGKIKHKFSYNQLKDLPKLYDPSYNLTGNQSKDQGGGGGSILNFRNSTGGLISQYITDIQFGTGLTPTYASGKVTLTSSGSSLAIGGTITGGTANSILFINPSSTLAQDNANFNYIAATGLHVGTTPGASNAFVGGYGGEFTGSNTVAGGGINLIVSNTSNSPNAFSDLFLQNDLSDSSVTHFAVVNYNSSTYNNSTFGTAINVASQLAVYGTDGPTLIGAFAATGYVNFVVGGSAIGNEIGRFTTVGLTIGLTGTLTGAITFAGGTSTSIKLQGQAIGSSGVLTLPATTDTLIGKATTDTFTNKTFDTAGTGNSFKINGTAVTAVNGTGAVSLTTNAVFVTPTLGAATATSLNGITLSGSSTPALTVTGTTAVSGTNTGDQTSVSGNSGNTNALQSATTTVNTSLATAPTTGQVLTATDSTHATWQTPSSGGTPKALFASDVSVSTRNSTAFVGSGSISYTTPATVLSTGATISSSANLQIRVSSLMYASSPLFSGSFDIDTIGANNSTNFMGVGTVTVNGSGHTFTANHIGFKLVSNGTITSLFATQADGTTENASSALTTFTGGDRFDLIFQVNGTSSIDYYWRKNGGALSSATNLTTNMPSTATAQFYIQVSVSNNGVAANNGVTIYGVSYQR